MNLLDVFIGEDATGSLQLALALSRSSGDDGLMQTDKQITDSDAFMIHL